MKNRTKKQIIVGRVGLVFAICIALVLTSAVTTIGTTQGTGNQMTYSFAFKEPTHQAIQSNGAIYTSLSMPGCLSIGRQIGEPTMPVKPVLLLLPPMTTVSQITVNGNPVVVSTSPLDLTQKPIFPAQPSVPIGSNYEPEFTMNSDLYSSDALYPAQRYSDVTVSYSHGYTILSMNLHPLGYNPKQGMLMFYPELTVQITLKPDAPNQFFRNTPSDSTWVRNLVINSEVADLYTATTMPIIGYPGGLCDPSDHYDYVIITTTQNGLDYWDTSSSTPNNWDSLLAHHAGNGLAGKVVTKQQITACSDYWNSTALFNDTQAKIREFCKDAYQDWGTLYVLVGGNDAMVPARKMHYAYEGNIETDIYYSNLDNTFNADNDNLWGEAGDAGFDLYAEIYIGRVTCNSPQDVSNWLTKNFYYVQSNDPDYIDNAAFYGGDTGWSCQGDDFIDYSALQGTDNWLGPNPGYSGPFPAWAGFQYGFETWNEVNPGNMFNLSVKWTAEPPNPGGWKGGSTSAATTGLKDAINNDLVTLIAGIAHASPTMSLDVYQSAWQTQYHNTKPFFIHDYGCHCGDFAANPTGVLHTMLFMSDTKLAFGCVYNTGYGWGNFQCTNSSSAFQQKEFWHYFFDMENNSLAYSEWQLGKGHAWSKDRMAPTINWDASAGTWRGVIQGCLLFGDPAQTLRSPYPSDPPAQPTKPSGETFGIWHYEYSYTSSSTDPEGDEIFYLFEWGDGSNSGWLGPYPSGATATGSHTWTELGTFSVTVKARDIWGSGSPPSEPLLVTITDNTPPNTPSIMGPTSIKPFVSYTYTFNGTDDQHQDLTYEIDWGDGNGAAGIGPYLSGEAFTQTHTWKSKGTFVIRTRTTDTAGAKSDWATIEIAAPFEYRFSLHALIEQLFEMFPRMFPILRHLMGYS
jgi:hypothetical protein